MEKLITEEQLKNATNQFLILHWADESGEKPEWSKHWTFKIDEAPPNYNLRGCYALWVYDNCVYIGSGISSLTGTIYEGFGLAARLKNYYSIDRTEQKCIPSNYKNLKSITTIGFNEKTYYLALSLEAYLIINLKPERNTVFT